MNTVPAAVNVSSTCHIVIADDHAILRDGLSAILSDEPGFEIVGTAEDGKAAVEAVGRLEPDLVLIDLSMPRTDGSQAITMIKQRYPAVRVVVLTYHKEDVHIHAALKAGADGYVLKDDGRDELIAAVRNVYAGRSYLSPAICDRVMSGYVRSNPQDTAGGIASWEQLSAREQQVLKLVAEGYKTREIAEYLSLSEKTIEKHRASMMHKLDLHGVSAVTAYAIENGLLAQ
jgi:DNA-binding NarL/FixJ family response regulator